MKKIIGSILFCITTSINLFAQNNIKGIVKSAISEEPLQGVFITVKDKNISILSKKDGFFQCNTLNNGDFLIEFKKEGYETQRYPVTLLGKTVNLGTIFMYEETFSEEQDQSVISITDDELNDDATISDNISGLLQSSKDTYLRAAAFEFSASFFKIRGLDSDNAKLLINGIEMNKLSTGRPEWSNWGGLNDVLRNQEFTNGLAPSNYTFGGVLGATNISTRASQYRKETRVSYASSNRSYRHRAMATYSSGLLSNGWAFSVSASKRIGDEGFVDGTFYDATSIFSSVEKIINDKHSINLTGFFASNKRGLGSSNTQEVIDLKGIKYNSSWGYQNGNIRNSRIKNIEEPFLIATHYWNINDKTTVNTTASYQFGKTGRSRIDYNGGANPNPADHRNLPSFYLAENDIEKAYEAEQNFINNGQLNWNAIYNANLNNSEQGINAAYVLYEDRTDDKTLNFNTIITTQINDNISVDGKVQYTNFTSDNFANVLDNLGSTTGYLDVNGFAKLGTPERQNDVLNPNREVSVGDRFKYNYLISSQIINGFLQAQFKYHKIDFYLASEVAKTSYQREGLYQNGTLPSNHSFNSLGKSPEVDFFNFGVKGGATYKITGRHLLDINAGYITKAPTIRDTFTQIRDSNLITDFLTTEKILSLDASYIVRSPIFTSRLTGYYITVEDGMDTNFFFSQGLQNEGFSQEIVTGVNKLHAGIEVGFKVKITPDFHLKGAGNFGNYFYTNDPKNIQLAQRGITNQKLEKINFGTPSLKNYRLSSGPQKAYSLGIDYRDPDYWWASITGNYFEDAYIGVSSILRSSRFFTDNDGLPITEYDPEEAKKLLTQQEFGGYFVANIIGGKSWKIRKTNKYIGFTLGISNFLNQQFKTGGFEQSRKGDFRSLKEDFNHPKRVFSPRFWNGRGANYFFNIYFKF